MPEIWFTSDTHLFHKGIRHKCRAEFTNDETADRMNEAIIAAWNARVKDDDIVYHLGDVSFASIKRTGPVVQRLRGKKKLVPGNHDKPLLKGADNLGNYFEVLGRLETLKVTDHLNPSGKGHQRIELCHYCLRVWDQMHHGAWHLHGHSHGNLRPIGRALDVGIDTRPDLAPYSYEEVKEIMTARAFVAQDHHKEKTHAPPME